MFTLKITHKNGFVEQVLLGTKYHYILKSEREQFNDWETIFGEQSREDRPPFDDEYGVLCAGVHRIILTGGSQYEIDIWDSQYKEEVADFNTIYDSFIRGCVVEVTSTEVGELAESYKLRRQNKAQRKIDFPTQSNEVIKTKPIKPRRRSAKYQMNEVTNKSNLEISLLWGLIKISK